MVSTARTGSGRGGAATAPQFRDFVQFAEQWLLPMINVRLAEARREQTYTWCTQWWAHRPVAVRIAHLHTAFEATRRSRAGSAMSSYLSGHVDAHFRTILDAANGPLHRCTRAVHVPLASLPFDPVPFNYFGTALAPPPRQPAPATADPDTDSGGDDSERKPPPPRFGDFVQFVEQWLLPTTAVRIAANSREGQYTWCQRWWEHRAVAIRFAALHRGFEAALRAEDKTAMSGYIVRHLDPHLRSILDAANGPLHRCRPDEHVSVPGLPFSTPPRDWFATPGIATPTEDLGFGPDFRALRAVDQ
ncbi:DUF4913 domain-containing protein [Nocardia bhagyanarayanae]|uniref:Uncharacterized protein DUF4913 n=1 Tax=Nocardia bhagyanarayanae TaxID=1215925 RepID=A0A543FG16_9NOCA|nr:DUF4913 domain-containing protein [Nocardia bhagyanarayanae]TQM32694.1 uncharacterized protein DUF4913 [Nocardia bhagyanarayanae]